MHLATVFKDYSVSTRHDQSVSGVASWQPPLAKSTLTNPNIFPNPSLQLTVTDFKGYAPSLLPKEEKVWIPRSTQTES